MSGWPIVLSGDEDDEPAVVPEGTPGAVPTRREVDAFGRVFLTDWIVPAPGAAAHWDIRRAGPGVLE